MSDIETWVDMFSERCNGHKLKHIRKTASSSLCFAFEGDDNEEWYISISGKELNLSFGKRKLEL